MRALALRATHCVGSVTDETLAEKGLIYVGHSPDKGKSKAKTGKRVWGLIWFGGYAPPGSQVSVAIIQRRYILAMGGNSLKETLPVCPPEPLNC